MKTRFIPGLENLYSVSDDGRVFSHRLRKIEMKPAVDDRGYMRVRFEKNGRKFNIYVHQAVAKAFLPNPKKKPCVNHLDADKSNNNVINLQWCTHQENIRHDWLMGRRTNFTGGRGAGIWNSKLTEKAVMEMRELIKEGKLTQSEIGRQFGVCQQTVSLVKNKIRWGYV